MTHMAEPNPAASETVLSITGLSKTFPGVVALDDVSIDLRPGEVHALLGANGAGKSTLIKIVSGIYRADSGEIRIDGEPVEIRDAQMAQARGISVIYQDLALTPHLSVAENIFLGREFLTPLHTIDWKRTHEEARRLLDRIGIHIPTTTKVRDLGTGQKQLVEIARALGVDAKILILDEPTASLSHAEADRLFDLVRRLAESGVGMIYVSHRLEEIAPLVDRVTILRDGRSVGTFPVGELDRRKVVSLITGHEGTGSPAHRTRTPGETLLELRGLTRKNEFSDISFSVRRGEVLVLTGLVGAGRTELLETVFGARRADSGEIILANTPITPASPRDAIGAGIALIPEDRRGRGVSVIMPVFANITLAALGKFARRFRLDLAAEMAHARKMITDLGIRTSSPSAPASSLSGGNQQKVALAKWLSTDAELFLFDEPTQGVDVGAKEEIYRLIDELAAGGKAVVVASSDIEEVMEIADRILAVRKGRIVGEFDNLDLKASVVMDAITHGDAK